MSTKKEPKPVPFFMTAEQAAEVCGIGENRLRALMDERKIEFLPVGNRRLITREALYDYYQHNKICRV